MIFTISSRFDRNNQTQQDMRPVASLVQFELGAAGDHLFAELDEGFDDVAQVQQFGAAAANGQHIGREARLGGGVAPQLVQNDFGGRIALQVHDDPHAFAAGFVANVADPLDPLFLGGFGNLFDQTVFADLIGNGGQNDRLAIATPFLDHMTRPHHDGAASGVIGAACAGLAQDQRRGREIGTGDDRDQFVDRDAGIVDIGKARAQHFAQIMGRDIGRHAHRDAARAVDQQVGEARG